MSNYKTDQENFWADEFGNEYIERNRSAEYLASNLNFFSRTFHRTGRPSSIIEFGANIGLNLIAIKQLFPNISLNAIEINQKAASILAGVVGENNLYRGSILEYLPTTKYEVALVKGVLIHIHPEYLPLVYEKLYQTSSRYILICEYYNPSPVATNYRGREDRLFKRDFAGEMLDAYGDLSLVDYGFCYKRDTAFPQDDITWFLLRKN